MYISTLIIATQVLALDNNCQSDLQPVLQQPNLIIDENPELAFSLVDQTKICPAPILEFLLASSSQYISFALNFGAGLAETVGYRWPHHLAFQSVKEALPEMSAGNVDRKLHAEAETAAARLDEFAVQSSLLWVAQRLRREISSRKFRPQTSVDLRDFRDKSFSQCDGDGMLEGILGVLGLLRHRGFFVEFGTQFGEECSSRNFRLRYGWRGVAFDAGFKNAYFNLRKSFITEDTIEGIFAQNFVPENFDLLIIDIDGQDIHVWNALRNFRAKVVQIEFDRKREVSSDFVVPRDPAFTWSGYGPTGSAVLPLVEVGRGMNYTLVGMDTANLFFVANEYLDAVKFVHMDEPVALYEHYGIDRLF